MLVKHVLAVTTAAAVLTSTAGCAKQPNNPYVGVCADRKTNKRINDEFCRMADADGVFYYNQPGTGGKRKAIWRYFQYGTPVPGLGGSAKQGTKKPPRNRTMGGMDPKGGVAGPEAIKTPAPAASKTKGLGKPGDKNNNQKPGGMPGPAATRKP